MTGMKHLVVLLVGATITAAAACSSEGSGGSAVIPGSCGTLASRCHPYDKVSAIGKECHDLGHDGDDAKCSPRHDECLAACPPTEAGTAHPSDASVEDASIPDGSAPDGSGSAPDAGDVCTPFCECMTSTCATTAGYPFTGTPDCVAKCPLTDSALRTCLPKWRERAKTLSNKTHTCEHAWGKFGLDECETL
jgi:hypothetical protein